jgi:phospholipase C
MVLQRFAVVVAVLGLVAACAHGPTTPGAEPVTATPIRHLVVICEDHYFGTYPHAANIDGQPFTAKADTPAVDGLTPELLTHNPNSVQPMRLGGPGQQVTCDQDHEYQAEQLAFNGGAMDRFVEHTEGAPCSPPAFLRPRPGDGLLRRQLGDRAVELRTALFDERQLLRHHIRSFGAGSYQPGFWSNPWCDN